MADILQITLPDGTTYDIKDNNALPLTGGTLTGDLILSNNSNVQINSVGRSSLVFNMTGLVDANTIGTVYQTTAYNNSGLQMKDITQASVQSFRVPCIINNTFKPAKFYWYYKSVDSSLNSTNYFEIYSLPEAASGLTANTSYDILTSKNAITIAQGGTGATTAADAWTALGGGSVGKLNYGSGTTTYLRNDGTWVTPDNNKVTQTYATASSYTYWRPLVVGYSSGSAETFTPSTQTNTTYTFNTCLFQPSSGTLRLNSIRILGTNTSSAVITADGAHSMYIKVNSIIPFVVTETAIRSGNSVAGTIDLGTSTNTWNNVYANYFYGSGANLTGIVTNVSWDSTNRKIQKTIGGTTSDVVTLPLVVGTGTKSAQGAGGAASGENSFAFERGVASADYSFAFGSGSQATGTGSIAFMHGIASGLGSFAIGAQNGDQRQPEANGTGSIAIGASVYSSGIYSIAIGLMAEATANMAIAIGNRAIASSASQLAVGKYNIEDANNTYAFIIGNGSSSARSNAMTVDWNGNISANNIVTSTSVSNTGLISFLNSSSTAVYTVQLPLYNGGVS